MANDKITMLKLKRMLQLLDAGRSMNQVCAELHMSKRTVHSYKERAEQSEIPLYVLRQMPDEQLNALLQPPSSVPVPDARKAELDKRLDHFLAELKRPYVTKYLLWEEYRRECPDGYQYTQFKKYLNQYRESKEYSYSNTYLPGHEMLIDFAGDKLYYRDKGSGEWVPVDILCCILPYSNKAFAMALPRTTQEWLFCGLGKCLQSWGCAPAIARSDNMSQWVRRESKYERPFTESTDEWATYYDSIPDVARVKKPKDKAPVEGLVSIVYKYVYARMRDEVYDSLDALNRRIAELVAELNDRPLSKRGRSRNEIFFEEEYGQMHGIPDTPFSFRYRKTVKVGSDYHVIVGEEQHRYSVPYKYVGSEVTVLWDVETVEVYDGLTRILSCKRDHTPYGKTTLDEHMPPNHLAYKRSREKGAMDYLKRASEIGPETRWAIGKLLSGSVIPQYAYRDCDSFFRLAVHHGPKRIESACALIHQSTEIFSFKLLKNMIRNNTDKAAADGTDKVVSTTPNNPDVRGASSYKHVS